MVLRRSGWVEVPTDLRFGGGIFRGIVCFDHGRCIAQGRLVDSRISRPFLLGGQCADAVLDVFEGAQISGLEVVGVLEGDDVLAGELLICDQVSP